MEAKVSVTCDTHASTTVATVLEGGTMPTVLIPELPNEGYRAVLRIMNTLIRSKYKQELYRV